MNRQKSESSEIGSIRKRKYADIVAVKGDPLKDISELERVAFVMEGGKVIDPAHILQHEGEVKSQNAAQ